MFAAALGIVFAVGAQNPTTSDAGARGELPVSLSHIREALAKPSRLRIAMPEPTFRVEIRQHPFFTDIPWTWDFAAGGVPMTAPARFDRPGAPPLIQVDLLPLLRAARKAHAEHAAEDEVRRALAEFCATHVCPDQ